MANISLNVGAGPNAGVELSKGMAQLKQKFNKRNMGNINIGGILGSTAGFLQGLIVPGASSKMADTSAEEASVENIGNYDMSSLNNFDAIKRAYEMADNTTTIFDPDEWRPDKGGQAMGMLGDIFSGISSGWNMGSSFGGLGGGNAGIYGGLAGAGLGAIAYGIKTGIENKKANEAAQEKAQELHDIGERRKAETRRMLQNQTVNVMGNMRDNALLNIAAYGGPLYPTDFNNGVMIVDEGGSHESNPYGGIQMGIAQDGIPNLVEEGEVIYNDYVYSARLKVPRNENQALGLKKGKTYTYAEAAETIQKESAERPNDPLSKSNLDAMFSRLQGSQEILKQKKAEQELQKAFDKLSPEQQQAITLGAQYALGGHLFSLGGLPDWSINDYDETSNIPRTQWEREMFEAYGPSIEMIGENNPYATSGYTNPTVEGSRGFQESTGTVPHTTMDTFGHIQDAASKDILDKNGNIVGTVINDPGSASTGSSSFNFAQALRAAPILGSALGTLSSFLSKPDYSNIKRAEQAAARVPYVKTSPIGNKLGYTPIDTNYIATQLGNQNIGMRRLAAEQSLGNAATAMNAIQANNYRGQTALANALMQARQANTEQRARIADFNRGTDQYNSAQAFEAARANQQLDWNKAQLLYQTGQLRDTARRQLQAERSANLTNLFQNIGNLGQDILARQQVQANAARGIYGNGVDDLLNALYLIGKKGGNNG